MCYNFDSATYMREGNLKILKHHNPASIHLKSVYNNNNNNKTLYNYNVKAKNIRWHGNKRKRSRFWSLRRREVIGRVPTAYRTRAIRPEPLVNTFGMELMRTRQHSQSLPRLKLGHTHDTRSLTPT